MNKFTLATFLVFLCCCGVCKLQEEELPPEGANVCKDFITTSHTKVQSYYVSHLHQVCCQRFLFCMKYCNETRYSIQTRTRPYTTQTPFYKCCSGWKRSGNQCLPYCDPGCQNGRCTAPNHCDCDVGYTGARCELDIDECLTSMHNCEQNCTNEIGSYTCSCREGYELSANNKTCQLIPVISIPETQPLKKKELTTGKRNSLKTTWTWIFVPAVFVLILLVVVLIYWKRRTSIYGKPKTEYSKFDKTTVVQYHTFENEELATL